MKGKKDTLLKRLEEIRKTVLEELSDDQVLEILAERKRITQELELLKKQQENRQHLKKEHDQVEGKISEINKRIDPDKGDEELLELVHERQELEGELMRIERELEAPLVTEVLPAASAEQGEPVAASVKRGEPKEVLSEAAPTPEPAAPPLPSEAAENPETVPEPAPEEPAQETEITEEPTAPAAEEKEVSSADGDRLSIDEAAPAPLEKEGLFKEDTFGSEGIRHGGYQDTDEYARFLPQLEANRESLSSFLQDLPRNARASKAFMLKVADIDPAYAMHYAADELKREEDFNIKVAGMRNTRNSGNPLAEMLPEMRTGKVILAGIKQDFRNVRFAQPSMPEYDEILATAKKGALEKVKELKEAADVNFLIPKILQKDKAFMEEVEKSTKK